MRAYYNGSVPGEVLTMTEMHELLRLQEQQVAILRRMIAPNLSVAGQGHTPLGWAEGFGVKTGPDDVEKAKAVHVAQAPPGGAEPPAPPKAEEAEDEQPTDRIISFLMGWPANRSGTSALAGRQELNRPRPETPAETLGRWVREGYRILDVVQTPTGDGAVCVTVVLTLADEDDVRYMRRG
ncbi:MAG TPA: hypothetical protein VI172_00460 [Candidatus Dormibacteraeota bacterium]|jgi:hypothetical protein